MTTLQIEGSSIEVASVQLTPPAEDPIDLACAPQFAALVECSDESPDPPAVGYGSFATLLSVFPPGDWTLSVNDGLLTATLAFAPVAPTGHMTVSSPDRLRCPTTPTR